MAIKFQFNKTSLNDLNKQLKVRTNALPTLKNKESALRMEVKRAKYRSDELLEQLASSLKSYDYLAGLWTEFEPGLISVKDVELETVKIAGIKTPSLKEVIYDVKPYNFFKKPVWYADGIKILQQLAQLGIESEIYLEKMRLLEFARKKTTQKVNLYEKVQIPGYKEAILKIKRFMEDEENLSKASQKIVKNRQLQEEAAL
ncbi:V-type ATP synthase subunit D [bioreactor metagenome]|jgi:V/A-type H+-transporting ATPase subunit D|uniref:V-type ATP synthase subunit D n=1 Tax=bioreactor metagenome TaxID=1076179 RepID=A0A644W7Y6_9ZZZZ|nr:V-type ATP synthase subunit D [Bacteroidales bacterium]WRQ33466.1 V-type ATP synthase subunit D [Bacteroidales bacterium MB20-C3-3]MBP6454004.1 V-type ATP synthase subunit D [Bacteroidales bacterium]MBP8677812.1 V-type ATP synthase subunit D [Bacteroidales bacterium]MBP9584446.1 V-type ATP synthase subunit D [Bacteroidales bacterium]